MESNSDLQPIRLSDPQKRGLIRFAGGRRCHHATFSSLIRLGLIGEDMLTGGFTLTADGRDHVRRLK